MIAYHFPPLTGSSGIHRTLKFWRDLPRHGWQPLVLTISPGAYETKADNPAREMTPQAGVHRAFGLDTARHLSVRGRYPRALALPDRWISWWPGGVALGLQLIRREQPNAIWSTYPIATAHLIALTLRRLTGLPWLADFRDPMFDAVHPYTPVSRKVSSVIERRVVGACSKATFTAPGTLRMFAGRYPEVPASRYALVANGYSEEDFALVERSTSTRPPQDPARLTLLHSGTLYPLERDPAPFFAALAALLRAGQLHSGRLKVVLRATGHDDQMRALVERHGVGSLVELAPPVGYHAALEEMLAADGLILLQAANCNHQIPAKLYEYLRARRPILALTDLAGDTAAGLRDAGIDTIAPLDSQDEISRLLVRFLEMLRQKRAPVAGEAAIAGASRQQRSAELASLLDAIS